MEAVFFIAPSKITGIASIKEAAMVEMQKWEGTLSVSLSCNIPQGQSPGITLCKYH